MQVRLRPAGDLNYQAIYDGGSSYSIWKTYKDGKEGTPFSAETAALILEKYPTKVRKVFSGSAVSADKPPKKKNPANDLSA